MKHIKLAVIADDFTGGADAASFLKRKHANVVLLTGSLKLFLIVTV